MDLRILSVIIRTASLGPEENPVKSHHPLSIIFLPTLQISTISLKRNSGKGDILNTQGGKGLT